jgi:hypothetical protein
MMNGTASNTLTAGHSLASGRRKEVETDWSHLPRTSDRVTLTLQIRISGTAVDGHVFSEKARTLLLSPNGAMIIIGRNLTPQEEILIRRDAIGKESPAQVLGLVKKQADGFVYGVKLLNPTVNLWEINFIPLSEEQRAVGRTLLQCGKCGLREVIYLEEFEIEVYHANQYIYHTCNRCGEPTIWNGTKHDPEEWMREVTPSPPPPPPPPPPESQPAPRTKNERRHNRIGCKLQACIRYESHFDDEVLEINDVARGGVSFKTRKYLAPGTKIEIAVPYSKGMANIFVPAEIVRLKAIPDKNLYEYGAAYIKRP